MPNLQPTQIAFERAEPQLLVTDLARSLAFYTEKLGFQTQFTYGDPPFYAQVARGAAHLNLRLLPTLDPKHDKDLLAATICVQSIEGLQAEYERTRAAFHQNLKAEPWGAKTFIIADPDGNLILFAE